jgi:hypothetical protein
MQDLVTTNIDSLFIPASSVQLLPTTPIVASGGGGRVFRVELREAVVSPCGVRLPKGTSVVRSFRGRLWSETCAACKCGMGSSSSVSCEFVRLTVRLALAR